MTSDEEKFYAWLDGELSEADAEEMRLRVASEPRLTHLADQHRAMQAQLKRAFEPVIEAPVPSSLHIAVASSGGKIIDLSNASRGRRILRWSRPIQWAALAATLALGVLIGTLSANRGTTPVEVNGSGIIASGSLNEVLGSHLASAPTGDYRIGVTFRDRSGTICRSFTHSDMNGLACRSGNRWRIRGLFAPGDSTTGEYRMAAGVDSDLAGLIDSTIEGEAFDASQESAAKEAGWR